MAYDWRESFDLHMREARRRDKRVAVGTGIALALLVPAVAAAVVWRIRRENALYAEFMNGCQQEHKRYECITMWRAGDNA